MIEFDRIQHCSTLIFDILHILQYFAEADNQLSSPVECRTYVIEDSFFFRNETLSVGSPLE